MWIHTYLPAPIKNFGALWQGARRVCLVLILLGLSAPVIAQEQELLNDDFESANPMENWVLSGDWRLRTNSPCLPNDPGYSSADTALAFDYGTVCAYRNNRIGYATLRHDVQIPVSSPSATLAWWDFVGAELGADFYFIQVSTDGGQTWPHEVYRDSVDETFWDEETADLSDFIGQSIRIRFGFSSDATITNFGWYVDDVRILAGGLGQGVSAIAISSASLQEGAVVSGTSTPATLDFNLTIDPPNGTDIVLEHATSPGTASPGYDYIARSGPITIPAGQSSFAISVQVIDDVFFERDEVFNIAISDPSANATITVAKAVGTILDNEELMCLYEEDFEPRAGSLRWTVPRPGDDFSQPGPDAELWHVQQASICIDPIAGFSSSSHALVFNDESRCTYDTEDGIAGSVDMTVGVLLTNPDTSVDDDVLGAQLSFRHYLEVMYTGESEERPEAQVWISTDGGQNFESIRSFTPAFPSDSPIATPWTEEVLDLTEHIGDDVRVRFSFSQPAQATRHNAAGWFVDDVKICIAPRPDEISKVTVSPASALEGNSGTKAMDFNVSIYPDPTDPGAPANLPKTLAFQTVPLSITDAATPGVDYVRTSGQVVIPGSDATSRVRVLMLGEDKPENNEFFDIRLRTVSQNIFLVNNTVRGEIQDDDAPSVFAVSVLNSDPPSQTVNEEDGTVTFEVQLQDGSGNPKPRSVAIDATFSTVDGTALSGPGLDYVATTGTLRFPANTSKQRFTVNMLDDEIWEDADSNTVAKDPETFTIKFTTGSAFAQNTDTVITVLDPVDPQPISDAPPELNIQHVAAAGELLTVPEGSCATVSATEPCESVNSAVFIITLTDSAGSPAPNPTFDTHVDYTTVNGNAVAGIDYEAQSGTLVIPAGESVGVITVPILADRAIESGETFDVVLSNPVVDGASDETVNIITNRETATIVDDDYFERTFGANGNDYTERELPAPAVESTTTTLDTPVDFASAEFIGHEYQTLYGWDVDNALKSINLATGEVSAVGADTGLNMTGLAWDNTNGFLYATAEDGNLYEVNPTDGTLSAPLNAGAATTYLAGVAVHPNTGRIYVLGIDISNLADPHIKVYEVIRGEWEFNDVGRLVDVAPGDAAQNRLWDVDFDNSTGDLYLNLFDGGGGAAALAISARDDADIYADAAEFNAGRALSLAPRAAFLYDAINCFFHTLDTASYANAAASRAMNAALAAESVDIDASALRAAVQATYLASNEAVQAAFDISHFFFFYQDSQSVARATLAANKAQAAAAAARNAVDEATAIIAILSSTEVWLTRKVDVETLETEVFLPNPPVTSIAIATPPPPGSVRWTRDMYYTSTAPDAVNLNADTNTLTGANAGAVVSGIGDINGDGVEDLVISAPDASAGGKTGAGKVFVFFGSPEAGYPERVMAQLGEDLTFGDGLIATDIDNGLVISGALENQRLGVSVTGVGDMNGDLVADFAIGYEGANGKGGAYLIFGANNLPTLFNTSVIGETNLGATVEGVHIIGEGAGDLAGSALAGGGDFNVDGLGSLLIGAPNAASGVGNPGATYVVFGSATGIGANGALELSALMPPRGIRIYGESDGDDFGAALSGAGDVNGDGMDDIVVGARNAFSGDGAAYVILGHVDYASSDAPTPVNLARLNVLLPPASIPSLVLTTILPEEGDLPNLVDPDLGNISPISGQLPGIRIKGLSASAGALGSSVAGIGDMNGDGLDDVVAVAPDYDGSAASEAHWGRAYILLGSEAHTSLIDADGIGTNSYGLLLTGIDEADGLRAAALGDVNGDGRMDLGIGAPLAAPGGRSGETYVLYGRISMEGEMSLRDIGADEARGFYLYATHETPSWMLGRSIATAGDFNNDSVTDWIVGHADGALIVLGEKSFDSGIYRNRMTSGISPLGGANGASGASDLGRDLAKGVGMVGDGRMSIPASRALVKFKGGGGPGQLSQPSSQTVTYYRYAAPDVAVGDGSAEDDARWVPANVHWRVHTTRREFTKSQIEFFYRPEDVAGLDLNKVSVFYAKASAGVPLSENTAWSWLPVTPDPDRNAFIVDRSHNVDDAQIEFNGYYAMVQADLLTYLGGVIPAVGVTNENVYAFGPVVEPEGLTFWHSGEKKLYAIDIGEPTITWRNSLGETVSEVRAVNLWPEDNSGVYQEYVAKSTGVVLSNSGGDIEFPYSELTAKDDSLISNADLTSEDIETSVQSSKVFAGDLKTTAPTGAVARSMIMLSTEEAPDQGELYFQFNKTRRWDDVSRLLGGSSGVPWDVGLIISGSTDVANFGAYHDDNSGSPLVLFENAPYALRDTVRYPGFYDRSTRTGSIVPVNEVLGDMDDLVLVFYEQGAKLVEAKTGGFARHPETRALINFFDWPYISAKYDLSWPTDATELVIARQDGSGEIDVATYGPALDVYVQNSPLLPGYNPNEEHAIVKPYGGGNAVFALRDDLNDYENVSEPFALMTYQDPNDLDIFGEAVWKIRAFSVTSTTGPYIFGPWAGVDKIENPYWGDVAAFIQPPYPLSTFQYSPLNTSPDISGPGNPTGQVFEDRNFRHWAMSEAPPGDYITMQFYYPPQLGFYFPADYLDALETALGRTIDPNVGGSHIPWLDKGAGHIGTPIDVAMRADWPTVTPEMNIGEILLEAKFGLPQINGQCSVDLIYQQSMDLEGLPSAELIDPVRTKSVELEPETGEDLAKLPDDIAVGIKGSELIFTDLPPELQYRISYDPNRALLKLAGIVVDPVLGFDYILLNVINANDRDALKALSPSSTSSGAWHKAVNALYAKANEITRIVGGQDGETDPFQVDAGLAAALGLSTGNAQGTGYVTLAFQNADACAPLPVSVEVIKVVPNIEPGSIAVVKPNCVFEEKLTMMQTIDFAGHPENFEFEWLYQPDSGGTIPADPDDDPFGWTPPPMNAPTSGTGINQITISGPGLLTLTDNWFVCRYRSTDASLPWHNVWSDWTPPQLAEGWIKRVVGEINPFTQRGGGGGIAGAEAQFASFGSQDAPFTLVSMISQAGPRWTGSLPLNCEALDEFGLIPIYETVLGRGMDLSINALSPVDNPGVNTALLLVASRIADLYTLLGNEAFADAADPTIAFGTDDGVYGAQATSIHAFMNQTSSLLEEELGLLRGRDDTYGPSLQLYPLYNRLIWNFTRDITGGEVAYALNYNITDEVDGGDGRISEADAARIYPQGHGDAWGHYLTAMSAYYKLLGHPFYTWANRSEAVLVGGQPVTVDYIDESRFARIAAAKARTGSEIVNLTYREKYVEDPGGQWQGYKDDDDGGASYQDWVDAGQPSTYFQWVYRGWGFSEWASRAGQGTYLDWIVGNGIMRHEDPDPSHTGITKIDRTTVPELAEVAEAYDAIAAQSDAADLGLNPLGLGTNVVPFDIDPTLIDDGLTHFEQIFTRASTALSNAETVFNTANNSTQLLRRQADSQEDFERAVLDTEKDYNSRLIEIFGYPYDEDIGPGGTYPSGYEGPDLFHYMYSEESGLFRDDELRKIYFKPTSEGNNNETIPSIDELKDLTEDELEEFLEAQEGVVSIGEGEITFEAMVYDYFGVSRTSNTSGSDYDALEGDEVLPSQAFLVEYNFSNKGGRFGITKPSTWTSERRATGEIQQARAELVQAMADFMVSIDDYGGYVGEVEDQIEKVERQYGVTAGQLELKNDRLDGKKTTQDIIFGMRIGQFALRTAATIVEKVSDALQESVPTVTGVIIGFSNGVIIDGLAPVRGGLKGVGVAIVETLKTVADGLDLAVLRLEQVGERKDAELDIDLTELEGRFANLQAVLDLQSLLRNEIPLRIALHTRHDAIQAASGRYLKVLAEGQRVQSRLLTFRNQTAADVQSQRYKDMAFRIFRNDAVQKYRAQYDLAQRYVYMTAKAYDYETTYLSGDPRAGQKFLTDIVRERQIGSLEDGLPQTGVGLANSMAVMARNFEVLDGQLGFNNPQSETNRFSLRHELLRILPTADGDDNWRTLLSQDYSTHGIGVAENLWDVPEFSRFAVPPAGFGAVEPGIVIPFSTIIEEGKNFFGRDAGGLDSSYDSTHFATKVRSVGIWFSNYDYLGLSNTPRVWLVPAGVDVMRSPTEYRGIERRFNVLDQLLPVPFPIGASEVSEPGWIPSIDSLSGPFESLRRFGRMRAYHDSGEFSIDEMHRDSRLVGRSVWNTKWMLIIPASTLSSNRDEGLDRFINGQLVDGVRNGNGVSDIKLFFETYAYPRLNK